MKKRGEGLMKRILSMFVLTAFMFGSLTQMQAQTSKAAEKEDVTAAQPFLPTVQTGIILTPLNSLLRSRSEPLTC